MSRALVLSGGGSRGAFQVGVMKHLMGELGNKYNSYCGISVGALNSAYLAMFKENQSKQAIVALEAMWLKIKTSTIYKRWCPFGKLHGLWEEGLHNTSPLHKLVQTHLSHKRVLESGNNLCIGAVSLETGEYKLFDENYHDLPEAVLASSAFPVMFQPVELEGQLWTDGGVRDIAPMGAAIDLGADEIDVVLTSPEKMQKISKPKNIIDVALRVIGIMTDEIMDNDVDKALLINELAKAGVTDKKYIKINIYCPTEELPGDSLDFSPDDIKSMIDKGYKVAKMNK